LLYGVRAATILRCLFLFLPASRRCAESVHLKSNRQQCTKIRKSINESSRMSHLLLTANHTSPGPAKRLPRRRKALWICFNPWIHVLLMHYSLMCQQNKKPTGLQIRPAMYSKRLFRMVFCTRHNPTLQDEAIIWMR
jgi:hypothetical protein